MPRAQTIEEVIQALTGIIAICTRERSRLGYFPALYRRVTERVREGIVAGRFEDGPRMARLDVTFANRYLDAWEAWRAGAPTTAAWRVAFEAGDRWSPVILQHLLCGMNAHINLDLAIAAAETCPGAALAGLERDFDEINLVLAEEVNPVERELAGVSPWIGLIDTLGGRAEDRVLNFGIRAARELAWENAVRLAVLHAEGQTGARAAAVGAMDAIVAGLGLAILHPGPRLRGGLLLVRIREEGRPARVIAALASAGESKVAPPGVD